VKWKKDSSANILIQPCSLACPNLLRNGVPQGQFLIKQGITRKTVLVEEDIEDNWTWLHITVIVRQACL
jgi:hypothetical protein